ncbi:hypothetical protein EPUL_005218 [Erysiphe pulchra]|uniref:Exportin-T n=1 Tax=Erysiphe pulchra TaxID=225359 RepID=A0A2S4PQK5_9PEZI|nr:hypothetical protein EPUL_005218 [Erysiphe pulchra]
MNFLSKSSIKLPKNSKKNKVTAEELPTARPHSRGSETTPSIPKVIKTKSEKSKLGSRSSRSIRNSNKSPNPPRISYDSDLHPLNLPPEERRQLSILFNMPDPERMDEDTEITNITSSPLKINIKPLAREGSKKYGSSSSPNGEGPVPPPHRSNNNSPIVITTSPAEEAEIYKCAGNKHYKAKEFDKAILEYTKAVQRQPSSATYLNNRAAAYISNGQYSQALDDCIKASLLEPQNPKILLRLARIYTNLGRPQDALDTYSRIDPPASAKDVAPAKAMLQHFKVAEDSLRDGSCSMALHALEQAEKLLGTGVQRPRKWQLMRGEAFLKMGNVNSLGDAQNIAMSLLRTNNADPEALVLRGRVLYAQGENEKAITHFRQALNCDPDYRDAIKYLRVVQKQERMKSEGNVEYKAGNFKEAIEKYSEALEIDPSNKSTNSKLLLNRALCHLRLKNFKVAIADCERAIVLDPSYTKARKTKATATGQSGDWAAAIREWKNLQELDPTDSSIAKELRTAELEHKKSQRKDYYKLLGVEKDADASQIKKAYRKAAIVHHPDKNPDDETAEERFKDIGEAYETLSDPEKRRRYDNGDDLVDSMQGFGGGMHGGMSTVDPEIQNAVDIAWDPSSNQELKVQALQFLSQLRSYDSGRQACVTLFIRVPPCSEVARLVCLDVINNAIQSQEVDLQGLEQLKKTLLEYISNIYGSCDQNIIDPAHIQNKLTQTLTLLFIKTYKHGWETFFDDFLGLTAFQNGGIRNNFKGTMLYLRILGSVHDEIGDVYVSRSSEENRCNSELKDALRSRDVPKIVLSWHEILSYWKNHHDAVVVETCLKVIGKWVSWIDISLIMNQDLLNTLFQFVGQTNQDRKYDNVRDVAISTLTEIVAKKMKPSDKIAMIVYLNLGQVISQLIASPPLNELRMTSSYDTDLAEIVAKLINNVVSDIVKVLDDTQIQSQTEVQMQAQQLIQAFLPLLLRFLSDEYDEICSTVIPSLTELLTFLRKSKPLPPMYTNMLTPILNIVIQKMRYDDTSSWGNEDEQSDEAEFQELRKRLQVLQKGVAAVDESLSIEIVSTVVGNTFQMFEQQNEGMNWRDLDLALHEMNIFGEFALNNCSLYIKNQPSSVAAERLVVLISKMIDSGIASYSHPAIKLQYMEICVRYCPFFENQIAYIPHVLENFVVFVHHSHIRVRTRSWYLFSRFVKHLRAHIGDMTEKVIESISDLLKISAELPNTTDDISSEESDLSIDANFNSQLNLFESIGCISSSTEIPVDNQVSYIRSIINPLFSEIGGNIEQAKSGNPQSILQIHHVMMALGYLAHGFSAWIPKNNTTHHTPPKKITEEFARVAEVILISLESLNSSFDIRTAARACFSRLIGVLGTDILQLLPRWIDGLLSESSSKDEIAMFLRLLDQVIFSFKKEIYGVLNSLLTPLLQRIFASLAEPITGTDDEIQLAELRREYLTFIQVILNNELGIVFVSESNQRYFEHLILSVKNLAKSVTNDKGSLIASRLAVLL